MKFRYLAPFLALMAFYVQDSRINYRSVYMDCHPDFLIIPEGNDIFCYEELPKSPGSRPALVLESSLGDGIYDRQIVNSKSACVQCHPRPGLVDGKALLEMAEAL